jgi:transposase InsO family protein
MKARGIPISVLSACNFYKVSRSGYYGWKKRRDEKKLTQSELKDIVIKKYIMEITQNRTYTPGKKLMKELILKKYRISVSVRRISRLMKELSLKATGSRRKDAYKGQLEYFHPYAACQNYVNQDFYIGCRSIILTDITYLYYDLDRKCAYLCTFIDPFTHEVLGWKVSSDMKTSLVTDAYANMMARHEDEFPKDSKLYIHSDQGCQYMSAEYKDLIDGTFIQSMSRRGNSQDNAPQESFFGTMKERMTDHMKLCKNEEQLAQMIDKYIEQYNSETPVSVLGGLTPELFYKYQITGIFPMEEYFGVSAEDLHSLDKVIASMRKKTEENLLRRRERDKERRQEVCDRIDPLSQMEKDLKKLEREERKLQRQAGKLDKKENLIEETKAALKRSMEFYKNSSEQIKEELRDWKNWKSYEEMSYIESYHKAFA